MIKLNIFTISILSILVLSGSIGIQQSFATHSSPVITGWNEDGSAIETTFEIGSITSIRMHCDLNNFNTTSSVTIGIHNDNDDAGGVLDSYTQEDLPIDSTAIQDVDITPFYNGNPIFTKYTPGSWDAKCIATDNPFTHYDAAIHINFDIVDTTPPTVTAQDDIEVENDPNQSFATIYSGDIDSPTITDADPRPGSLNITRSDGLTLSDPFPIGVTTVTLDAWDASGNFAEDTMTVTVNLNNPPVITLVGDNPQTIEGADPYVELGATALDDIHGDVTTDILTDARAVDTSTVGTYYVFYDVSDIEGNDADTVNRTVNVIDTTPPVISLIDSTSPIRLDVSEATYTEQGGIATDAVVPGDHLVIGGDCGGGNCPATPGIYTITYDATDGTNAADQINRTVTHSEVYLDPVLINEAEATEAFWAVDEISVSGTVEGALQSDTVTVFWGDGITSGNIGLNLDYDENTGTATWGPVSHPFGYGPEKSGQQVSITAKLKSGSSEIATSDAELLDILPHETSLIVTITEDSQKWDHTIGVSATLTDTTADPDVGISSKTVDLTSTGIINTSISPTDVNGNVGSADNVTVEGPGNVGTHVLYANVDLSGDTAYDNPAEVSDSFDITPHQTSMQVFVDEVSELWDHTVSITAQITDEDEVISPSGTGTLDGHIITITSDALVGNPTITTAGNDFNATSGGDNVVVVGPGNVGGPYTVTASTTLDGDTAGDYLAPDPVDDAEGLEVGPHDTSLFITSIAPNVKWDHSFEINVLLTDLNFTTGTQTQGGGALANNFISFSGDGVAGTNATGNNRTTVTITNSTANLGLTDVLIQANSAGNVGTNKTVIASAAGGILNADIAGDYNVPASTSGNEIEILKHNTTTTTTITEDSVLWDHVFHATTVIIDDDKIFEGFVNSDTGSTLGNVTFTYSGPGVAGEDLQSHNSTTPLMSNGTNSTATTGEIALQAGNATSADGSTAQEVASTFAETADYNGSADQTDSIILDKHSTTTSLNSLVDLVGGTSFTPSGLVTDNDRVLMDDSIMAAELGGDFNSTGSNFVNFDTGSFVGKTVTLSGTGIGTLDISSGIKGITVTDPNGNFATNSFDFKVLELHPGGIITLPEDTVAVTLEIRNLDFGDNATFSVVSPSSPDESIVTIEGTDLTTYPPDQLIPNYVTGLISQAGGISQITFDSLNIASGDTAVEISAFYVSDPEGEPQVVFSVEFNGPNAVPEDELVLGIKDSITFIDGAFHDIVLTELEESSGLQVTATFAGSDEYKASISDTKDFDTIFSSWGVGGNNVSITPDTGTGFTSVACGTDIDGDSICDGWEYNKEIQYVSANGNLAYSLLPSAPDRFGGFLPSPSLQHKDIYVEVDYMQGHKPDEIALRDVISKFFGSDASNPSGTGISLNVFVDEELTHVDELNVWADNDNDLTNDFASIKSRHFGTINERASLSGTQTSNLSTNRIDISGLSITTPDGKGTDAGTITFKERITTSGNAPISIGSVSWTPGTTSTSDFFLYVGSSAKSITQESANTYILQVDVPYKAFTSLSGAGIGTIKVQLNTTDTVNTSDLYKNSPIIFSNLIKTKSYIYHYFIWAHSIGECGPSGIAETDGNDGIVALGCDFSVPESGDETDSNNNLRTVGSRQEQAGTFAHELGHNLGLLHGGPRVDQFGISIPDSTINCKPNYDSVMSYSRQIPGPTVGLLSLGQFSAGYSNGNLPDLNENSLNEQIGIDTTEDTTIVYGAPTTTTVIRKAAVYDSSALEPVVKINWDGDGTYDSSTVSADINNLGFSGCGASPNQSYSDHDDWNNLNFNFRGATGQVYDGIKGDPKKIADYTPVIAEEVQSSGLYYTGTFDPLPADGTGDFKLGSTIPYKFQLWSCNPHLDTNVVTCVDESGIFGPPETLTCVPEDPDCNEVSLQLLPDEMIYLQVTKTSDGVVQDGTVVDISEDEGSTGYFEWKTDHYQFNLDTTQFLGDIKGKGKKNSGVGGEYSLLAIILQDGVPSLLVDLDNQFFIPSDVDRDGIPGIDNDAGFPVSMQITLVG